ncbi:MAG: hypothetical protein H6718_33855 [Polyangiaceae bacterium]|nr:hypothetical protein [Myxococcales bacterium]MCB9590445.1 hypothetical protein [Polyangiaceae bacterium]MCB9608438.1 hypothetical protein [Polyangiaceae bacterium]
MTAAEQDARRERGRRLGRRISLVIYGVVVAGFTAVCTVQILATVWFPPEAEVAKSCREGLHDLISGVRSARRAAAEETGGEREAVTRFRQALGPGWERRPSVSRLCEGDPEALKALKLVDQLRYAEEHAVRNEAGDLAGLRRRVKALEGTLKPAQPGP